MMEPIIAIAELTEACIVRCNGGNADEICNDCEIEVAFNALRKQIPKEIKVERLEKDVKLGNATFRKGTAIIANCPSCGEWVNKHHEYCYHCGQKLRWK